MHTGERRVFTHSFSSGLEKKAGAFPQINFALLWETTVSAQKHNAFCSLDIFHVFAILFSMKTGFEICGVYKFEIAWKRFDFAIR